jgi:hypothetical protein
MLAEVAAGAVAWSTPGMVTVASGHWGSTSWRLGASEPGTGAGHSYCISVTLNGKPQYVGCSSGGGGVFALARISVAAVSGRAVPQPYLRGIVVPTARELQITFSNGQTIRTSALPPPSGLSHGIWFLVAPIPCGAYARKIVARGSSGQVVATWPNRLQSMFPPRAAVC